MMRPVVRVALILVSSTIVASCGGHSAPPVVTPARPAPPSINDGRSLVSTMRAKYNGQFFKTLAYTQNNVLYLTRGGETKSQWREYISVPGRLRIDYVPLTQRSGVLFDGSQVHTFDNGKAIDVRPGVNAQLLVTTDIYALPADRSVQLLDSLGVDLSKLRRDTWEGQTVYITGAGVGDSTTSQLWVDTEKLVTVRFIQKEHRGSRDLVTDMRFGKFGEFGGAPLATEVTQYRDGRLVFKEQLADVRVNDAIPEATFDPAKWVAAQPKQSAPQ